MKKSIRVQQFIALLSVVLFAGKLLAWYLTGSVTVLTDALEGIVNMVAGFLGLYSLWVASKPRDHSHPYGHGKAQFLSAAVEGTLITVAGLVIVYKAIERLVFPHELERLDTGLLIVATAGAINFTVGKIAERIGNQQNSMVLISAGHHLVTDAYSGLAIIAGLVVLLFTNNRYLWIDSAIALFFAVIIIRTGYKVIRKSVSGIMDETDMPRLQEVITLLQTHRRPQWVDIHHLRVLDHSGKMHVDAHMTVPRYFTISEADAEIKKLDQVVKSDYGANVEVFVQVESCSDKLCACCGMPDCAIRAHQQTTLHPWTLENMWREVKHPA
ncbi:MAG: cation transporter [Chitinophagia bacterium]|nr:cation transporter [Chitinophagia bacterium]